MAGPPDGRYSALTEWEILPLRTIKAFPSQLPKGQDLDVEPWDVLRGDWPEGVRGILGMAGG